MPVTPPRPDTPSPIDVASPPIGPSTPPATSPSSSPTPSRQDPSLATISTTTLKSATSDDHSEHLVATVSPGSTTVAPVSPSNTPTNGINHVDDPQGSSAALHEGVTQNGVVPNDTVVVNGENVDSSHSDADGEWSSDDWMQDMRRVKVYELIGSRWTDRGTALCTGIYDEEQDQAAIVARSEITDMELLRSEIRVSDVYQRQQDTLIVWTEPDGTDYALSFQDLEGCAEIWDFIMEVQRHFRGKSAAGSSSSPLRDNRNVSANSIINAGRLPDPTIGIISEIDKAIKFIGRTAAGKEKICEYIVHEDYIKGLIDVMAQAEDLEALGDLHALCNLVQTILMMNDHSIYDYILQDEIFMGVIGMLEYDPEFPTFKASFRDYLKDSTRYKEVVFFKDEAIRKKIHQTYRLQYLKDVVLGRVLDDPTFNVLNSFILFNQIDIVNHIQHDEGILKELFTLFKDGSAGQEPNGERKGKEKEVPLNGPDPPGSSSSPSASGSVVNGQTPRKQDIILFIHQLCMMGKSIQIPTRLALYRTLVDKGLLYALQWALQQTNDPQMLNAAGEILLIVVDHDVGGVRTHVLKQAEMNGEATHKTAAELEADRRLLPEALAAQKKSAAGSGTTLLTVVIKLLTTAKDLAFRGQMADALRTILELPGAEDSAMNKLARLREDPSTEHFLQYFYDHCIANLYQPLVDLPEAKGDNNKAYPISRDQSSICLYLSDLLCNFVLQHAHRSQYFVLSSAVSSKIASLLRAREKHLRLGALRFFRVCIKMNNNFLLRHLIKHDMFTAILDLTLKESQRDNLINSSCQEFFEYIRRENLRMIINHLMDKHASEMRELARLPSIGERFEGLIKRWEINNEPPPKKSDLVEKPASTSNRWNQIGLDNEEEDYFNGPDEEEAPWTAPPGAKRKRTGRGGAGGLGNRPSRPVMAGGMALPSPYPIKLVDYADEDEDLPPAEHTDDEDSDDAVSNPESEGSPPPTNTLLSPSPIPANTSEPMTLRRTTSSRDLLANGSGRSKPTPTRPESPTAKTLLFAQGSASPEPAPSATVGSPTPSTPPPSMESSPTMLTMPLAQKRRRDDEDDEMLGLLATKSKRQSLGAAEKRKTTAAAEAGAKPAAAANTPIPTGAIESKDKDSATTKKIKLSLGKTGFGIASSMITTPPPITADAPGKQQGDGG